MISAPKHSHAALLLALLIGVITGCGAKKEGPDSVAQAPAESMDSLRTAALELIGVPVCDTVTQCRSIAYGSKPCGGPWSYLIYSTQTTDSTRLAAAVAEYNACEARLNRELGRMSDCRYVAVPKLACVAARCSVDE